MWVVDMQKKLDVAEPSATVEKWPKHCTFRVLPRFRMAHGGVYKPQTVALGPFHHTDADLLPMEAHKRRAVWHLLRRAGKKLTELAAAVEVVAGELEDAYEGLGSEWRFECRGWFMEMMVTDGCFLLKVMRRRSDDYAPADPIFSRHAVRHIAAFVQRDMLMIENQLPLLVLHTIVAVKNGQPPSESSINGDVLKFLGVGGHGGAGGGSQRLGLHPLDLYRRNLLGSIHKHRVQYPRSAQPSHAAPRSALKLWEAGIRFRRSATDRLDDVDFKGRDGVRAVHEGHGGSPDDVALLAEEGILWHDLAGGDPAVVSLFNGLTKDVVKTGESRLCSVRDEVEHYCNNSWRVFVFESWAKLKNTYFTSPWESVALVVSVFFIATNVIQTAYAIMSYEHDKHNPKKLDGSIMNGDVRSDGISFCLYHT